MPASPPSTRSAARAMPGVLLVLTGADVVADGLKPDAAHSGRHEPARHQAAQHRRLAAPGRAARRAGDRSRALRRRGGGLRGRRDAGARQGRRRGGAGRLRGAAAARRHRPSTALVGDPAATRGGLRPGRAMSCGCETDIQRVTGVPMEPRAALGALRCRRAAATRFYAGGGAIVRPKKEVAIILGIEPEQVRVIAQRGRRQFRHPQLLLSRVRPGVLGIAPGRPAGEMDLRTAARRSSATMPAATCASKSELALDADGSFLGLRATSTSNLGAYTASFVPLTKGTQLMTSLYRMPAMARARGVLSNTPSTAPYRSAGRPEVMFVIERLIDLAARAHGFDRVELRRRNLDQRRRPTPTPSASPTTAAITWRRFDAGPDARRLERVRRAPGEIAGARAPARHRARRLCRIAERRAARARRGHGAAGRRGRDRDRHAVVGPGPCHQLRPARQRMAGRAARQGAPRHRRQRPRVGRRRLAFRPLDPAGRDDDPSGLARHHRPGPQARRAACSRRPRPTSSSPTAASPSTAPTAASTCSALAAERAADRRRRPTSTAGSAPIPMAGMSARSRSTPRPGWRAIDALHHDRRCRPRGESADPARPDPWRHRPGRGPGADGALLLRRRDGQLLSGSFMDYAMPRADDFPFVRDGAERGAVDQPSARLPRRRRGRHHAGAGRDHQRRRRRAGRSRRHPHRHAGQPERVWRAIRDARPAS